MPPRSKQPQELPQAADAPTALPAQGRTSQRSTRSSNSLPGSTMPPVLPNQGRAPSTRRSSNAAPSVPCMPQYCSLVCADYTNIFNLATPQATGTGPAHARAALNPITEETVSVISSPFPFLMSIITGFSSKHFYISNTSRPCG